MPLNNAVTQEQFPGPIPTGIEPFLYMHPEMMQSLMNPPDVGIRPIGDFRNRMFAEARESAGRIHEHSMDLLKATVVGSFLGSLGVGRGVVPRISTGTIFGGPGKLTERLSVFANQSLIDVYGFLGGRMRAPEAGDRFTRPTFFRPPFMRQPRSPTANLLTWLLPRGTGMKSMLFWNLASGNFEENFSTWSGIISQVAKYTIAAQAVNIIGAKATAKGGFFGDIFRSVLSSEGDDVRRLLEQGKVTSAMSQAVMPVGAKQREKAAFARAVRETEIEIRNRPQGGIVSTFKKFFRGEAKATELMNATRSTAQRWASSTLSTIGVGTRVVNFLGGMTAALGIVGEVARYRSAVRDNFQRSALSYETAFSHVPQLPEASSERQRAIEAIQSSSLNLRSFIGQESALMHGPV